MDGLDWYVTETGSIPFQEWVEELSEERQHVAHSYVLRVARGGSRKNVKYLGDELWEIKIPHKHGAMRVYFGKTNGIIVLLGGGKSDQRSDIRRAKKRYWRMYVKTKANL